MALPRASGRWRRARAFAPVLAFALAACGGSSSPPDESNPGTIVGTERLGWDQPAGDAAELATFGYALIVDDASRTTMTASCGSSAGSSGFACSAPLPPLSRGTHTLQIVTYLRDNPALESPRSMSLVVTVTGAAVSAEPLAPAATADADSVPPMPQSQELRTRAGLVVRADVVTAIDGVNAMTAAPDGRLFVADRLGRIRIVTSGSEAVETALAIDDVVRTADGGGALDIAFDPAFADTRLAYVLDVTTGSGGAPVFRLARYREAGGRFGERAVLMMTAETSPSPSGTLAFGADGRLYVALDSGPADDPSAASLQGKLLRLNPDGTTPADQRGASPIVAGGYRAPSSLRPAPDAGTFWLADAVAGAVQAIGVQRRSGVSRLAVAVPEVSRPSAIAAFPQAGDLRVLVAALDEPLLVLTAPVDPLGAPVEAEPLALEGLTRVRAIERLSDGSVIAATSRELVRLTAR